MQISKPYGTLVYYAYVNHDKISLFLIVKKGKKCIANKMAFNLDTGTGHRPRLELLVLELHKSIEDKFRPLTTSNGKLQYDSCLANGTVIVLESLSIMKERCKRFDIRSKALKGH